MIGALGRSMGFGIYGLVDLDLPLRVGIGFHDYEYF
jgi:hypothetical protein